MKKTTKTPKPTFEFEQKFWETGYDYVIGIDEVGRGAFAGLVVVGAVVFEQVLGRPNRENKKVKSLGINDSKLLSPQKREKLDLEIRNYAQFLSIATVGVSVINKIGIGRATSMAFRISIASIIKKIEKKRNVPLLEIRNLKLEIPKRKIFVLADGFHVKYIRGIGLKNQKAIIKGDRKSMSIAAASIIAKVYRDNLMRDLDKKYPQYRFATNKGYGTKIHQEAIKIHGLSKIHRKSFNLSKFIVCPQLHSKPCV